MRKRKNEGEFNFFTNEKTEVDRSAVTLIGC